jgi:serine/threonine-protein kinase
MTPGELKRVEEVYFRASGLSGAALERLLEQECGGDATLRAEVRSLLEFRQVPEEFLATPQPVRAAVLTALSGSTPADDAVIGRVVGRYRVVSCIASGGMGTVYLGVRTDGEFTQQVAIKIVKRGMDTDEIIRRFRLERQTLANLSHPNIAGLLDGGATEDGRPFLVMEYVNGRPIDQYCDERALDTSQRLRLFLDVCRAVQSAHQNLVIHRDLKPGNILVTTDGVPKLLDFGIATVLHGSTTSTGSFGAPTIPEQRRLTPEYASPEQIQGAPVTTASDVYSLGVILFELLSGRRPYHFRTRTTAEIERVVCGVEPPLPSAAAARSASEPEGPEADADEWRPREVPGAARGKRLRGDLDTIVLMALRKEPARRYATVEQLAGDIDRYLRGLPVSARKDTFTYRAGKFVRRHALASAAGASVALAVLLGAGGIAWQARKAAAERDGAFLARDEAEQIAKFLRDTLASANPSDSANDVSMRHVLDETAARLDAELSNRPLVHASVLSTIGTSYLGLGVLDKAEACITRAMEERRALVGSEHHDSAESMLDLAAVYYATERFDQAEPLLRHAMKIFRSIRGDHNLDIARTANDLGAVLRARGNLEEAESLYNQALQIRRAHEGTNSLGVAETLNNLAAVLQARGNRTDAEAALAEALRIRRVMLPPMHARIAQSVDNLAVFYASGGEYERARPLFKEAISISEQTLGPTHPDLAITLNNYGAVLILAGGPYDEAEALLRRALAIRLDRLPPGDSRTAYTRSLLGRCLLLQKRYGEAEPELLGALADLRQAGPRLQKRALVVEDDLVRLYEAKGEPEKAAAVRAPTGKAPG